MTILITGGAGFIGSNFIPYFLNPNPNLNPNIKIVNIINLLMLVVLSNLDRSRQDNCYTFAEADLMFNTKKPMARWINRCV